MESDRLIVSVGKKPPQETGIKVKSHSNTLSLAHRCDFKQLLQGITGEMPLRLADINFKEFAGFQIAFLNKVQDQQGRHGMSDIMLTGCGDKEGAFIVSLTKFTICLQDLKPQAYRNAYDIPRRNLLDQLTRMRSNLLRTTQKLIRGQDEGTFI